MSRTRSVITADEYQALCRYWDGRRKEQVDELLADPEGYFDRAKRRADLIVDYEFRQRMQQRRWRVSWFDLWHGVVGAALMVGLVFLGHPAAAVFAAGYSVMVGLFWQELRGHR